MVSIHLFGSVEVREEHSARARLGRKPKEFLAFLVVRRGVAQRREKIAEALWPERPEDAARSALNTGLWRLKSALEANGLQHLIRLCKTDDGAVALLVAPEVEIDCLTMQDVVQSAAARLTGEGSLSHGERARLQDALALYCGPFLEGYDAEWLLPERERLHCLQIRGLSVLMHAWARHGCYEDAIDSARRILAQDPLREMVQRQLMWLHLMNGQRGEAITQYLRLAELLRDELGIDPMAETKALYEHILAKDQTDFGGADDGIEASSLGGVLAFIDDCARRRADVFDALAQAEWESR